MADAVHRTPEDDSRAAQFYREALRALLGAGVPFLVGGGYAFAAHTGIDRPHSDFDVFVREGDYTHALDVFAAAGYRCETTFPHWLGKVHCGDDVLDVIFSSGNGLSPVDDGWFAHAVAGIVHDLEVWLVGPEELIWTKAFIMERERFDGADVAHILLRRGHALDWEHLLARFGRHWRVLLAHCVLFGFFYPSERAKVPAWVQAELLRRMHQETATAPPSDRVCQGTLVSRGQYLEAVEHWGFADARLAPRGGMSAVEIAQWTEAARQAAHRGAGHGAAARVRDAGAPQGRAD
ncbi:MAG TPA: hypothetical protein VNA89_13160 [Gemmatimonadaceae bacterium]|nr:hypothetical protein [Gemmatimonadaceae bacterium]